MHTNTIRGTYGSGKTPCSVYIATNSRGLTWYVVDGSQNVNATYSDVEDGVDVEELPDVDTFTWPRGVNSEEELVEAIES